MRTSRKLLSTGQVAELCGFSPSAVLQWIRSGKLPAYSSPGGQNRIDPEHLLGFLHAHGMRVPPELESLDVHRVLIVEDEAFVCEVLERMLRESGLPCEVEGAENGVIGCMKIPTFRPHLIVLDVIMPELDGGELCHVVRASKEFSGTKLLLVTGYPDDRVSRTRWRRAPTAAFRSPLISNSSFPG